jgi:ATP-dependent helicase/nuclease subunit B
MQSFLNLVAHHIHSHYKDNVEKLCIVLPSKRGAIFFKQHLAQVFGKTIWLPHIISAEDIINELSELQISNDIDSICSLYESYSACYGSDAEPFDSFVKWGHLILQDFNEIDRYLANPKQLYENLKNIKEIENWSLSAEELSPYQKNYLRFMSALGNVYAHFTKTLLDKKQAYQGLAYREAVKKLETSTFSSRYDKILFCGFNALNESELIIFKHYLKSGKADLLWDADTYYLNDKQQEAGVFLRKNQGIFPQKEFHFTGNNFQEPKTIDIISVPKQTGQAMVVRQLVQSYIQDGVPLDKVAIVLANEKLLWPVLKFLPEEVKAVNITMEYPLRYTSPFSFFELIIKIQTRWSSTNSQASIYHKDLVECLRQPFFNFYLQRKQLSAKVNRIIDYIQTKNHAFISPSFLEELFGEDFVYLKPIFVAWQNSADAVAAVQYIITESIAAIEGLDITLFTRLELEYLNVLQTSMNRVEAVTKQYVYFSSLLSFRQLFLQIVGTSSVAFLGEPLRGLQIMGVLETRTLDFEHVIFVNVNEGVLPGGKSVNSFIPNDLKRAFGLPLYVEKDAIYAYHFLRLLQRAKQIHITYDSETDAFGKGEKSRFITQLQMEMAERCKNIKVQEYVATPSENKMYKTPSIIIQKNETTLAAINQKLTGREDYSGLSASALNTYKECSLRFYYRYGAHLKEVQLLEESAEANTFGNVLHASLEELYKPAVSTIVKEAFLNEQLKSADKTVTQQFLNYFSKTDAVLGKNVLQQHVLKAYVDKALRNDIRLVKYWEKQNTYLTLLGVEKNYQTELLIDKHGKKVAVLIKGTIDRLDKVGSNTRIIDYKTSIQPGDKFDFDTVDALFEDVKYNKQFQLFLYTWLVYKNENLSPEQLQPAIIAFKQFTVEPVFIKDKAIKQVLVFTSELLVQFESRLVRAIQDILDESQAFQQTNDVKLCEFCAYKQICHR